MDSSGNLSAVGNLTGSTVIAEAGIAGGTYTSGTIATSGSGTCMMSFPGGATLATASVAVPASTGAGLTIVSPGQGYTAPPTTATVISGGSGSAACNVDGSLVVHTYLGAALDALVTAQPTAPQALHGRIWFDDNTDWPLPVPVGLDATGITSAMVRTARGTAAGAYTPFYWGVGGFGSGSPAPASTWTVYDSTPTSVGPATVVVSGSLTATSGGTYTGSSASPVAYCVQLSSTTSYTWATGGACTGGGSGTVSACTVGSPCTLSNGVTVFFSASSGTSGQSWNIVASPGGTTTEVIQAGVTDGGAGQVLTSGGGSSSLMTWTTLAASATTDTTNAGNITSGTLAAARLPNPTPSTLGGVESFAAVSHEWINTISTSGAPAASQPACADLSGVAASCSTDTTNASNIGSGTLAAARLPNPTASTLGGVESFAAVSHEWINTISTSGAPAASQPACADLSGVAASCSTDATNASNIGSGTLAAARLPNPTASTLGGVESFAAVSHEWINTISTSGVPAASQPGMRRPVGRRGELLHGHDKRQQHRQRHTGRGAASQLARCDVVRQQRLGADAHPRRYGLYGGRRLELWNNRGCPHLGGAGRLHTAQFHRLHAHSERQRDPGVHDLR